MRIQRYGETVKIWASARDTYNWANRPGESWPCSVLSDNRLFVELHKGDLVDIALNGYDTCMVDINELNAFIEDALKNN